MDLDNNTRIELLDQNLWEINVYQGWIYCVDEQNGIIFKINSEGTEVVEMIAAAPEGGYGHLNVLDEDSVTVISYDTQDIYLIYKNLKGQYEMKLLLSSDSSI